MTSSREKINLSTDQVDSALGAQENTHDTAEGGLGMNVSFEAASQNIRGCDMSSLERIQKQPVTTVNFGVQQASRRCFAPVNAMEI